MSRREANTCVPHGELDCPACIAVLGGAEEAAAMSERPCEMVSAGHVGSPPASPPPPEPSREWENVSGYATCADCGNPLNDGEHFQHDVCDCCRESL